MDLLELEEIEESGMKLMRTRDLRIDEYKSGGEARMAGDEYREQRIEAHRERTEAEQRLRRWSYEVKIKDGWVCKDCGELDRRLLESDHIKPIYKYPELKYELSNGRCRCIRCHAKKHLEAGEPEIAAMILERLEKVA